MSLVRRGSSEHGTVLIATLMVIALLGTLGGALVLVVSTESLTGANYQAAQQSLYAADAGIERAIADLRPLATWSTVPATASGSTDFNDGVTITRAPDGAVLDLLQLTVRRQAEGDALYPNTPNRPVWRLFAHASLNRIMADTANAAPYVIVWMSDDVDEVDSDPATDTNDVVMIHAEAFGTRGGRRAIEATIQREAAMAAGLPGVTRSDVRLIAWREVR